MSKEFNFTANQIKSNYEKFLSRINKMFPDRASNLKKMYKELGEERIMFSPASGTDYYHNAIPGGYIDHVLRVMDYALIEYKHFTALGLDVSNFTITELMFAAMHHDLGKLGFPGDGNEVYVFNTSEWHRKNQGKIYSVNENIPFMLVPDLSLYLLQSFGVQCTFNEFLGIRIHDGLYDDANKSYYINRQLQSKLRNNLPIILHNADFAAARYEFERWNSTTNSLRTNDINVKQTTDNVIKETVVNKGNNLQEEFNELFN
jgi:hypothetical protein